MGRLPADWPSSDGASDEPHALGAALNATQIARIAHEAHRAHLRAMWCTELPAWESISPSDRMQHVFTVTRVMSDPEVMRKAEGSFGSAGVVLFAVIRACLPPVVDINDEPEVEPDRKPGYTDAFLKRDDPAKRELKKPSEVVVTQ